MAGDDGIRSEGSGMKGEGLALRCARDWMSDSVVFELCAYLGDSRHLRTCALARFRTVPAV